MLVAAIAVAVVPAVVAGAGAAPPTAAHQDAARRVPDRETGFDPQATSDLYSDHVQRAIFEPLYGFDYLARPYKRVPKIATAHCRRSPTADAMWTIQRPARHLLRRRSGVQGQAARADRRRLRLLVEAAARPAHALAVRVVPRRARSSAPTPSSPPRSRSGKFDYDAPIEGLRAIDRYTIRMRAEGARLHPVRLPELEPDGRGRARGGRGLRRRNGWAMDHPVGTGPYHAEVVAARPADRARKRIPVIATSAFPKRPTPPIARSFGKLQGQASCRCSTRSRSRIIEESNPRMLAFDSGALDYVERAVRARPTVRSTPRVG